MKFRKGVRCDYPVLLQPLEISLDQEGTVIEYVRRPFETAFLQPLLHDRDSRSGALTVFRDEVGKVSKRAGVVLGRDRMAKVLCPQEPLDELRVTEGGWVMATPRSEAPSRRLEDRPLPASDTRRSPAPMYGPAHRR